MIHPSPRDESNAGGRLLNLFSRRPSGFRSAFARTGAPYFLSCVFGAIFSLESQASIFYDYTVVAQSGENGLTGLKQETSINDSGVIAFIGLSGLGNSLWTSSIGDSSPANVNPGFNGALRDFAFPHVNNSGEIVARERFAAPATFLVRKWSTSGSLLGLVESTTAGSVTFPSISNDGNVGYIRLNIPATGQDATLIRLNGSGTTLHSVVGTHTIRPMTGNGGRVVARSGSTAASPIQIYTPSGIDSLGAGAVLTSYGQSPGISDDGVVVAFYGTDLDGPGIFLSVEEASGHRRVVRVCGFPGELGVGLGPTFVPIAFSSFDPDARVGVTHASLGQVGLEDDSIVVCFVATPNAASPDNLFTAQRGIWTARFKVKVGLNHDPKTGVAAHGFSYNLTGIMPVAQIGDTDVIPTVAITALGTYDPVANAATDALGMPRVLIANEHRVAFFATAGTTQYVIRASYFDTDEDALPDHWELNGVTVNGQFQNLKAWGARPDYKDLFVHVDWVPSFRPPFADLHGLVTKMFRYADIDNPNGKKGIELHIDTGSVSLAHSLTGTYWGAASRAGPVTSISPILETSNYTLEIDSAKSVHFRPAGRAGIFRYALFADRLKDSSSGELITGIARVFDHFPFGSGGGDFLVTLGGGSPPDEFDRKGTFAHELGHTLGLRHGGADHDTYKPNNFSVMNYWFQTSGLQRTDTHDVLWDYSRAPLPLLNESLLVETAGVGDPQLKTKWGDPVATFLDPTNNPSQVPVSVAINFTKPAPDSTPPADWDADGVIALAPYARDVNLDGAISVLTGGINEWKNLDFSGGGAIGSARGSNIEGGVFGVNPLARVVSEPTKKALDLARTPAERIAIAKSPIAIATYSTGFGTAPVTVTLDGSASSDPDGTIASWVWSFGDGTFGNGSKITHTYNVPGEYRIELTVVDNEGHTNLGGMVLELTVSGSAAPNIPVITSPLSRSGTVGDSFTYQITAVPTATAFGATGLPSGLTFDETTTSLSGSLTNAGVFPIALSATNAAGTGIATLTLTIAPATATVTLGSLTHTYDGTPKSATAITTPAGLPVTLTYGGSATAPTDAGSYAVVATINSPNYIGSANGTLVIAPATATVTLGNLSQTFDGTPKSVMATTTPVGLTTAVTYDGRATPPTNVGSYAVVGSVTNPNYTGTASGTLNITPVAPITVTVTLGDLAHTYDGMAKSAMATTTPSGIPVLITYDGSATPPTNVGSYAIVATVDSSTHTGSASGTLVIGPAPATVTLGTLNHTYDGTPKAATATTNPANVSFGITYDGSSTAPTNAGSYAVVATINSPNYSGSANGTLTIAPAAATVTLGGLAQTFDGSPKVVSVLSVPAELPITVTYNGSLTAPTNIGAYPVVATVTHPNYSGSATGTLNITQAPVTPATVTLGSLAHIYDGTPKSATATTSPAGLSVAMTYNGSATPPTQAGTYSVVAAITSPTHTGSESGTLVIGKAAATIAFGPTNTTYDGSPKLLGVTTTPVALSVTVTYDGNPNAPTNAGSYAVSASVNDANYQGAASTTLLIAKAPATVTLGSLVQLFDGSPKPATASTTPAGLAVTLTYDGSSNVPSAVGSYAVVGTITNANFSGAAAGTLVINSAVSMPINVTSSLKITPGGFRLNRSIQRFAQTITIQNISGQPISGPLTLVIDQLSTNAILFAPAGTTNAVPPAGSPYANVSIGADHMLSPGEIVTLSLEFTNSTNQNITYFARALAGPGNR